jgi:hypothetical protein
MTTHEPSKFLSKAWVARPEAMTFVRVGGVSTETEPAAGERKRKPSLWEGSVLLYTTRHNGCEVVEFTNSIPNPALPSKNSLEGRSLLWA